MSARSRKQKQQHADTEKLDSPAKSVTIDLSSVSSRRSFSRSDRSHSPLSISRSEEKDELAHLNDRLAGYIDYVRKLELDKQRLTKRIHSISEERVNNIEDARKTYEDEIAALRTLVDDLAKQKSKGEVEVKQAKDDMITAKTKLKKREDEHRALQRKVENMEKDLLKYKQDHEAYQPLLSDYHILERKFDEMRQNLEAETLLRTDLENKILGLKEQLDFRTRLFDEEREKLVEQRFFVEEEIETRKQVEYDSKLTEELKAIREETVHELDDYKMQIEETFETKLSQLRTSDKHNSDEVSRLHGELQNARRRVDDLSHDLAKKIAEFELLQRKVENLEKQLQDERHESDKQLTYNRQEVVRLKEQLEDSFRDFTDLMNTKIALDQEILMYRKMLEGEESRLNIQPQERDSPFCGYSSTKRRRVDDGFDFDESGANLTASGLSRSRFAYRVSSSANTAVEFFKEQDTHGKWVKVHNTSTEELALGNWEIVHTAGGTETRFKFYRSFVLKPGAACTIWSQDADATHNPPADIVMKNKSFHAGSEVTMQLLDADAKEQAKCTVKRERIRSMAGGPGRKAGGDDKCSVM